MGPVRKAGVSLDYHLWSHCHPAAPCQGLPRSFQPVPVSARRSLLLQNMLWDRRSGFSGSESLALREQNRCREGATWFHLLRQPVRSCTLQKAGLKRGEVLPLHCLYRASCLHPVSRHGLKRTISGCDFRRTIEGLRNHFYGLHEERLYIL